MTYIPLATAEGTDKILVLNHDGSSSWVSPSKLTSNYDLIERIKFALDEGFRGNMNIIYNRFDSGKIMIDKVTITIQDAQEESGQARLPLKPKVIFKDNKSFLEL